ncbi:hypothetical protein VCHENC02_1183B, partial [Vibrio harveyi]
LMKSSKPS